MKSCQICNSAKAQILRPKNKQTICKECFFTVFETEIFITIKEYINPGDRIAIGISGGKDSTVLAYTLNKLNIENQL